LGYDAHLVGICLFLSFTRPFFHPIFSALRRSKLPVYQKFLAKEATLYCMVACHVVGLHHQANGYIVSLINSFIVFPV
jgi:hypothetical protein